MLTQDFFYDLPPDLIAQHPAPRRDASRLLVLDRARRQFQHRRFPDLPALLQPGDLLVTNNSRVIPARLRGLNPATGGRFEVFLLEEVSTNAWWAMIRPGKRARIGSTITLLDASLQPTSIIATVAEINQEGHRLLRFSGIPDLSSELARLGEIPLPPYIQRSGRSEQELDAERYQTIFAQAAGSVAAPTAGLHFTPALLEALTARRISRCEVTLHVGPGTFAPVKTTHPADHVMHEERFEISEAAATAINEARADGRRIIAVGTTSLRVLETAARLGDRFSPMRGRTRIFIHPPAFFAVVSGLLTNFHLPCSTLLMLVSALASPGKTDGRDLVLDAYRAAIAERYRFFSYGDAMLLL